MGRRSELMRHAASHTRLLAKLDDTPAARATALAFFDAIRSGAEITPEEIAKTSDEFLRAAGCREKT